jgi:hypothetical protein
MSSQRHHDVDFLGISIMWCLQVLRPMIMHLYYLTVILAEFTTQDNL